MKKNKLLNISGKHVVFKGEQGRTLVGKAITFDGSKTLISHGGDYEISVEKHDIIGKVKKNKWFSLDRVPPENELLLLEHKSGDIRMGKLMTDTERELYELDEHHFHDGYWHKPLPINDFTHWSLVRKRG